MKERSFRRLSLAGVCVITLTAAFALVGSGCCLKVCASKCCRVSKCGPNCTKPCCAKAKCPADCTKPCCAKKVDKAASGDPVNKNCPVSGRPVAAGVTTVADGKTVGFCCGGCVSKWEKLTSGEREEKLKDAM